MGAASSTKSSGSSKSLGSSSGKYPKTEEDKVPATSFRLGDKFVQVDNFAKEMYINSPKLDALQHLLTEDAGKKAFMQFLKTEYAAENLSFFMVSLHLQMCTYLHGYSWHEYYFKK
jgi:hypothetical protein